MNWIHTLTNHFTDEQRVTQEIDKHSEAVSEETVALSKAGQHRLHCGEIVARKEKMLPRTSITVSLFL